MAPERAGEVVAEDRVAALQREVERLQQALASAQERLEMAHSTARMSTFDWHLRTNTIDVFGMPAVYGDAPDSFSYEDWRRRVHPDDVALVEERFRQALRDRTRFEVENRVTWPDGSIHWVHARAEVHLDEAGEPERIVGVNQDITERKQTEEALNESRRQFEVLTQNLISGVALIDEHGKFAIVNPAFLRMFHLSEESDLMNINNRDWGQWQVFGEDHRLLDVDEHPVRRAVLAGEPVRNQLVGVQSPGRDELTWMLISAEAVRKADGGTDFVICTYHDITARKKVEESLRESEKELREKTRRLEGANRELELFSSSVSHDLRAPLRAINGFSELLGEALGDSLEEAPRRYLDLIRSNTIQMAHLIDDLLQLSRASRGELAMARVDVQGLVQDCWRGVIQGLGARALRLDVGELPVVQGDYRLLSQAFTNLLGNAVKYTSERDFGVVEVKAEDRPEEVVFSVSDNGIGFDPKYADHIFTPFQRLHSGHEYDGSGVGLAIVRRAAERHGGRAWAEAVPGRGATFHVALPKR